MTYMAFCGKNNGDCAACLKSDIHIIVAQMYKITFWVAILLACYI